MWLKMMLLKMKVDVLQVKNTKSYKKTYKKTEH